MDILLPVPPGGLDGRGIADPYGPRYWRDIPRSEPVEVTSVNPEPPADDERPIRVNTALEPEQLVEAVLVAVCERLGVTTAAQTE